MYKPWQIIYLIGLISLFPACYHTVPKESTESVSDPLPNNTPLSTEISYVPAVFKSMEQKIVVNGTIQAHNKVDLKFERGGILTQFDLRNGSQINSGEIIAQLNQEEIEHQERLLLSDIETAQLDINERILLSGGEFGVDSTISTEQLEYIRIKSGINKFQQQLAELQFQKSKMKVLAPFDGMVADVQVRQHQVVTQGEVICTLIDYNSLEAEFDVLETTLSNISNGQKINIYPISQPDKMMVGVISRINPVVSDNGLLNIKARIKGSKSRLYHGMKIKVEILKDSKPMIVIPKEALVLRSNRQVVFTYEPDEELAKWNYVTVAHENDNELAISEGLGKDDLIIVRGNLNLDHDARVVVNEEQLSSSIK